MKITWGGHATTLISIGSHSIITDPNLLKRMWWFKRYSAPGLTDADLATVTDTVISHAHLDHLDITTLKRLPRSADIFVRGQIAAIVKPLDFPVHAMQTWDSVTKDGLTITCLPVVHLSGRWVGDSKKYLPASFMIQCDDKTIYFAGDTAYGTHFKEIAERFPKINVGIIPIGAYEPEWMMKPTHVNPKEALQAFIDLKAEAFIPIHWGTFKLSREPMDAPPKVLMEAAQVAGLADKIHILQPGESFTS